ncbi:MAG: DUF5655 domain-containing protein [Thiobacillus sp.]
MPLFANNNDKLTMLNTLPAGKEKALQQLIENNLPEVLDMHFIASEYRTTSGGRIDTLAVDCDGAPTIIEFKRSKNDNVINQALSYLKWLKAQRPEFFEMLMINRLGKEVADSIKLDWRHPRVVCVAESFSKFDTDTVEVVPLRIDLFKYRRYENGLFSLEMVTVNEQQKNLVEACQTMPAETNLAVINAMKEQACASQAIRALFEELRERILGIDEYIIEKSGKRAIAFRLTKNFAEVLIRKDRLVLDLREMDYVDPRGLVEKIGEGYTITMNRRITLTDPRDLDYVFSLVEQSYQNIL